MLADDVSANGFARVRARIKMLVICVMVEGLEVDLTASEFKLLTTLARYPGRVYTRMPSRCHSYNRRYNCTEASSVAPGILSARSTRMIWKDRSKRSLMHR